MITTTVNRADPELFTFPEVTDSVSLQYTNKFGDGTGYDICGPRNYQLFEVEQVTNNDIEV